MSILPRCVCGLSSYCIGGELCEIPKGDDVPMFSSNYVKKLNEENKNLKLLLRKASDLIGMARFELGEEWDSEDVERKINEIL